MIKCPSRALGETRRADKESSTKSFFFCQSTKSTKREAERAVCADQSRTRCRHMLTVEPLWSRCQADWSYYKPHYFAANLTWQIFSSEPQTNDWQTGVGVKDFCFPPKGLDLQRAAATPPLGFSSNFTYHPFCRVSWRRSVWSSHY